MIDRYYTPMEIAELLHVDIRTVRAKLHSGELAVLQMGERSPRVSETELKRFLAKWTRPMSPFAQVYARRRRRERASEKAGRDGVAVEVEAGGCEMAAGSGEAEELAGVDRDGGRADGGDGGRPGVEQGLADGQGAHADPGHAGADDGDVRAKGRPGRVIG